MTFKAGDYVVYRDEHVKEHGEKVYVVLAVNGNLLMCSGPTRMARNIDTWLVRQAMQTEIKAKKKLVGDDEYTFLSLWEQGSSRRSHYDKTRDFQQLYGNNPILTVADGLGLTATQIAEQQKAQRAMQDHILKTDFSALEARIAALQVEADKLIPIGKKSYISPSILKELKKNLKDKDA